MGFKKLILFLISLPKKSLSLELAKFFRVPGEDDFNETVSKSALSQSRKNLDHKFLIEWGIVLLNEFYTDNEENVKRWEGFRLIGTDGSSACVKGKKEVAEFFGEQKNQNRSVPMARLHVHFDLLNHMAVRSVISPMKESESFHAVQALDGLEDDMLTIYDRGYAGFAFLYLNIIKKKHFVIRYPLNFSNEIKEFAASGSESSILTFRPNKGAVKRLQALGFNAVKETEIQARAVRVILDTGETEILVTSLTDMDKYPNEIFKGLYFKRWGVETHFGVLKNLMQLEVFSGQTVESIQQDFYATVFTANLQSLIMKDCEPELEKINERRELNYALNRNVSLGFLKDEVVKIFLTNEPESVLKKLKALFLMNLEPARPGRQFPRNMNAARPRGKHRGFKNYKSAL